ncbi:M61 family peptidase [Alteromonas sp. ASW11-36]|uniref:M61 family peptidase n=1 Tax=Alteromonas arenosi TaxID=3055817 RepID=A0ABT7SZN7_9ALTE|nr:PDZ domain-containing protein [Alteromonas sp. ASW11-36]MDM7861017.1 M61 family peptidase [Alteromonas sp. ASW11-36]
MADAPGIRYTLQPHSISQHLFAVTIDIPAHDTNILLLTLPAWIPGSYLIRDFAKNIGEFSATANDVPISWHKTDKQSWSLLTGGQACQIQYTVYAFDLSVRSAYLCDEYGFINGTSAFMQVAGFTDRPHHVTCKNATTANVAAWCLRTGMPAHKVDQQGFGEYIAENYQALTDYPLLFGQFIEHCFTHLDIDFSLIFTGELPLDLLRMERDLKPILAEHINMFATPPPVDKYMFITLLAEQGYGGLEHMNSTVLLFPRWDLPQVGESPEISTSYRDFLALCSHEFLHTWHVKRIRPEGFEQYQLAQECYTEQLWIYEGFTSFYDDVALVRSGVIPPEQYLEILGKNITRIMRNPGRFKQSTAESSFDAWTRFYQQDANSINHIVSYYTKGGLIALCLDVYLRTQTGDTKNLDDVMRYLWQNYGLTGQGTPNNIVEIAVQAVAGIDCSALLKALVHQPGDLPLAESLTNIGVRMNLAYAENSDDVGGKPSKTGHRNNLGINVAAADLGLKVTQVREGGSGDQAGMQVNDHLIAINDWVVNKNNLHRILQHLNNSAVITLVRDGRLLTINATINSSLPDTCYLTISDETKFNHWLGLHSKSV